MRCAILFLLALVSASAAVDGTVVNRTTGKPQPGLTVTLLGIGQTEMEEIASAQSDAEGVFRIDRTINGTYLLQVSHGGVTYGHMLRPGTPTSGLTLDVFDSSRTPGEAKVTEHMVLFEPTDTELLVSEAVLFENPGNTTYTNPAAGSLQFFLPQGANGQVQVTAQAPQSMPVRREAEQTSQADVYKVDFPIRPGETRIDVTYRLPFSVPGKFSSRILHREGSARLIAPLGVNIQGEGLELLGQEPNSRASIYDLQTSDYEITIQGTGFLGTPGAPEAAASEHTGPSIQRILPPIYDNVYWIVGTALLILMLGFVSLYRSRSVSERIAPPHAGGQRRR